MTFHHQCDIKFHVLKSHLKEDYCDVYECDICEKSYIKMTDLKTHYKSHDRKLTLNKVYDCPNCKKSCSTLKSLQYHVEYFHVDELF